MTIELSNNRYQVVKKLGQGGMGEVYLVHDLLYSRRTVALKTIKPILMTPQIVQDFKREFMVMNRLKHPHLARVYDFGHDGKNNNYFITMEYLRGSPISLWISNRKKKPLQVILSLFVSLCRTLDFIHSRNIVHCDIKPGNIMMVDNNLKVMDFGLALLGESKEITRKGSLVYLAPEALRGVRDRRGDIFATGATLYKIVTGKTMYGPIKSHQIIALLKDERLYQKNHERALNEIKHSPLREIIHSMTEAHPDKRFQSFADVIMTINYIFQKKYELETTETKEAYFLGAGLVGREKELTTLKHNLEDKCTCFSLVHGDVGTGKSRLLQELKEHCQLHNFLFLEGSCFEHTSKAQSPFLPIISEMLLHVSDTLREKYGPFLKKIVPHHEQLREIEEAPRQEPQLEKEILVQNITQFMTEWFEASASTVILLLNDLQWRDQGTSATLKVLAKKLKLKNICTGQMHICLTSREEDVEKSDIVPSDTYVHVIELRPFDKHNVLNYIEATFGCDRIGESLSNASSVLHEKVGGNPFFLQEFLKICVERNLIMREGIDWTVSADLSRVTMPANLKDLILTRLDQLGLRPDEYKILQVLALLEHPITLDELSKYISFSRDFISNMEQKEVLKIVKSEDKIEWTIAHNLIQEVITDTLLKRGKTKKRELHHYIAEKMEEIHSSNLEEYYGELAHHFVQARQREKAVFYLEKQGDVAQKNYDNQHAIELFDHALSLLTEKEIEKCIDLLLKKGTVLQFIGHWAASKKCRAEALTLAQESDDQMRLAHALLENGFSSFEKGDFKQAKLLIQNSLHIFESLDDQEGISKATHNLAVVYRNLGDRKAALKSFKKVLRIKQELGNRQTISVILGNIGNIYWQDRDYETALSYYAQALQIADDVDDEVAVSRHTGNMGIIHERLGNYEQAMKCYQKSLTICEKLGDLSGYVRNIGRMGVIYVHSGNYKIALTTFQEYVKYNQELGNKQLTYYGLGALGEVHIYQHRYEDALHCFEQALAILDEIPIQGQTVNMINQKAHVLFLLERYDEAEACNFRALNLAKETPDQHRLFEARIMAAKLEATLRTHDKAEQMLLDILKQTRDDDERAITYYELWLITKSESQRSKALDLYKKLYSQKAKAQYRERIDELKEMI